jgi:flagellar M-ring protein FliF
MTSEKFDPEGQVPRTETQTEDVTNSTEARTSGAAGVSANVPDKAQGVAESHPTSSSEQSRKNRTTSYEINRTVTSVTRTPGAVKNVTAAVFIAPKLVPAAPATGPDGKPVPAAAPQLQKRTATELDELRQVVVNALGLKTAPGQSLDSIVSLKEVEFQAAAVPAEFAAAAGETRVQTWIEMARRWAAVVGAIAVLVVFWRMLSRQKPETVPIEMLTVAPEAQNRNMPNVSNVTPELLNDLIKQKPANVGIALREWVSAGASPSGKN